MKRKLLKWVLPLVIVLFGAGVMAALVSNRPEPKRVTRSDPGALVRIHTVNKQIRQVIVNGTGTVQAAGEATVIPQVSGRAVKVAPSFVAGGFIRKGELLFEIEDTDYRLALEQAKAKKANAEYEVSVAESNARVARTEWERLGSNINGEPNPLTLHEPQLKNAHAALASAAAALEQAKLDLERTRVYAPFNCLVRSETVEQGQYVRAGNAVASLVRTDMVEVVVPLAFDEMSWLAIPRHGSGSSGSPAEVSIKVGDALYRWQGMVVRSLGEVDPKSRMINVVVRIDDPYDLSRKGAGRPPLAVGSFVEVALRGKTLSQVVVIPRIAYRENNAVWIIDGGNKLRIKQVKPMRIERDDVIIGEGLNGGERVVLTSVSGAADGMKLRIAEEKGKL